MKFHKDVQILGDYVFGKTHAEGTIECMQSGETTSMSIGPFFGFGDIELVATLPGHYEWNVSGQIRFFLFPRF